MTFGDDSGAAAQRATVISSLGLVGTDADLRVIARDARAFAPSSQTIGGDAVGLYNLVTHDVVSLSWTHGDLEKADATVGDGSLIVRLRLAPGPSRHMTYRLETAATLDAAQKSLVVPQGRRVGSANLGGPGKWRNGIRSRLKSDRV